jgi:predicted metalloprotease with PDZ domain
MNQAPLRYQITPKDTNAHVFQVCLTLDNPNPLGQVFSLPNWIPGSYLIRDFAKQMLFSKPTGCKNTLLPLKNAR